jgi:hypothetical protein
MMNRLLSVTVIALAVSLTPDARADTLARPTLGEQVANNVRNAAYDCAYDRGQHAPYVPGWPNSDKVIAYALQQCAGYFHKERFAFIPAVQALLPSNDEIDALIIKAAASGMAQYLPPGTVLQYHPTFADPPKAATRPPIKELSPAEVCGSRPAQEQSACYAFINSPEAKCSRMPLDTPEQEQARNACFSRLARSH